MTYEENGGLPMLVKSLAMLAALLPSTFIADPSGATTPKWLVGFWQKSSDEDHQPNDVMEFRSASTFISYGYVCMPSINQHGSLGQPNRAFKRSLLASNVGSHLLKRTACGLAAVS
jgi:hypothetical protein